MMNTTKKANGRLLQVLVMAMGLFGLVGRANALADTSLLTTSRWSGWHQRGGITDAAPTTISSYSGDKIFMFAKGQNDRGIYFAETLPGTSSVSWQALGGTTYQPINAVVTDAYEIHAFHRGDDGRVYCNRRSQSGGAWTGWFQVPGNQITNNALAASQVGGRLYLFARRADNQIVYTSMNNYTRAWEGVWRTVGGTTDVELATSAAEGKVFLVGKGINDRGVYLNVLNVFNNPNRTWSGWRLVSGMNTSTALGVSATGGKVSIVARADNRGMYLNHLSTYTNIFSGWAAIPGGATNVRPSITRYGTNLVVAHRGDDNRNYENILQQSQDIAREITIPANAGWVDTGFDFGPMHDLAVKVGSGVWTTRSGTAGAGADGYSGTRPANMVLPSANLGALIGRIGGSTFLVGSSLVTPAGAQGRLYLSMNDVNGTFGDNAGSMTVTVASTGTVTVTVRARDSWTNTNILMRQGQGYSTTASGTWSNVGAPTLTANGIVGYKPAGMLVPSADLASLVGWVRNGFAMGRSYAGTFPVMTSPLYLAMNDVAGTYGDNQGQLSVVISPSYPIY